MSDEIPRAANQAEGRAGAIGFVIAIAESALTFNPPPNTTTRAALNQWAGLMACEYFSAAEVADFIRHCPGTKLEVIDVRNPN